MYQKHGDIIYSADIERRLEQLWAGNRNTPISEWTEDDKDEYNALALFRNEVQGEYGHAAWHRGISFVSSGYRTAYAAEMADERFGADAVNQRAWDDEVWEEDFYDRWKEFRLEDVDYTTDGNP